MAKAKFVKILKMKIIFLNMETEIYKQICGMPMGNALSATIANIIFDTLLEHTLANLVGNNIRIKHIVKYICMYVDDILALINQKYQETILKCLNKYH